MAIPAPSDIGSRRLRLTSAEAQTPHRGRDLSTTEDSQPEKVHRETVDYLKRHAMVIVTAESCTAGLIASRLAAVPGAGDVLESAFVVYDPKAKERHLGVRRETIERHNLTSEPVALEMARGALTRSEATLAIANTGVADGSDPGIEPGTQCYAWVFREGGALRAFTETKVFQGDRNRIRQASADHALSRIAHYHRQSPAGASMSSPRNEAHP
jgi:nicotinamide-nucleotide amidase